MNADSGAKIRVQIYIIDMDIQDFFYIFSYKVRIYILLYLHSVDEK